MATRGRVQRSRMAHKINTDWGITTLPLVVAALCVFVLSPALYPRFPRVQKWRRFEVRVQFLIRIVWILSS